MKAITVRQPWAAMIVDGEKTVENRSWRTSHRGILLIHAGMSRVDLRLHPQKKTDHLSFGAFVGFAHLIDCVPVSRCPEVPFREGPECWLLRDATSFVEPIPWKGSLGLFNVPDEIAWGWVKRAAGSDATRHLQTGSLACYFAPQPPRSDLSSIPTCAEKRNHHAMHRQSDAFLPFD